MHHDVLIVVIMQHLQGGGKQNTSPKSMNLPRYPRPPQPKQLKKHLNKLK